MIFILFNVVLLMAEAIVADLKIHQKDSSQERHIQITIVVD